MIAIGRVIHMNACRILIFISSENSGFSSIIDNVTFVAVATFTSLAANQVADNIGGIFRINNCPQADIVWPTMHIQNCERSMEKHLINEPKALHDAPMISEIRSPKRSKKYVAGIIKIT
ncbi:hypothetical protein DERP_002119 [Dermatophagoides pteronyssinus]|uniref:Uncharacterized protein n=1 Tax=Dermatophagoides pteronyssinus TaxID=6956 RepID=A0ABQ8JGX1_DERPT|nr:hypothetical protein DERP_002119 [Dermatophagoides pteronyssinus]